MPFKLVRRICLKGSISPKGEQVLLLYQGEDKSIFLFCRDGRLPVLCLVQKQKSSKDMPVISSVCFSAALTNCTLTAAPDANYYFFTFNCVSLINFPHLHRSGLDSQLWGTGMIYVVSPCGGCSLREIFWLTAIWMQRYHQSPSAVRLSYLPAIAL